jgi:ABC-type multidrug transport system fused ATPase/permease subunit
MSNSFWSKVLLVVIVGTLLFSLSIVFLPQIIQPIFNLIIFNTTESPFDREATRYIVFVFGVLGAVMVGWMVALLYLARRGGREAWQAITVSLVVWYLIDSGFSLYSGYGANAVLNTVIMVAFAVPLVMLYRGLEKG